MSFNRCETNVHYGWVHAKGQKREAEGETCSGSAIIKILGVGRHFSGGRHAPRKVISFDHLAQVKCKWLHNNWTFTWIHNNWFYLLKLQPCKMYWFQFHKFMFNVRSLLAVCNWGWAWLRLYNDIPTAWRTSAAIHLHPVPLIASDTPTQPDI